MRMRKSVSPQRRASTRFALNLEVSFTATERHSHVKTGSGRTIGLSSSELSFTTDEPLLSGQKLDVAIAWPVLLDGAIKLQLVMSGVVVRTNGKVAVLQIKRHEFRTRRLGPRAVPPEESVG